MIEIKAIQCPKCKDIIYSRARHDMRYCSCNNIAIDGGQEDYIKISYEDLKNPPRPIFKLSININLKELYDDWSSGKDKYGLITQKQLMEEKFGKEFIDDIDNLIEKYKYLWDKLSNEQ